MPKPERRDPTKERYWRRMLRLWQRSGQSGRDFCATHGLNEPSFYAWRREIARRDQEAAASTNRATRATPPCLPADGPIPTFVAVTVDTAAPAPASLEVVVAHGRCVRVPPGFDADLLRQLLRVLEEPSC
jgi:hypothetical protein